MTSVLNAVDVCRCYVAIQDEIKRLSQGISRALAACPANNSFDHDARPHLSVYYASRNAQRDSGIYGMGALKGEAEFLTCAHCVKAAGLIDQRKAARQKLGAVKRNITRIGRAKL